MLLLPNIISSSILFSCHHYSFPLAPNLHLPPYSFLFLFHGLICLPASLPASLCHAFTYHSYPRPPSLPLRNGFRWANFILVMPLFWNSQFGENGHPCSLRAFSFGQLGSFGLTLKLLLRKLWEGWCVNRYRVILRLDREHTTVFVGISHHRQTLSKMKLKLD